MQEEEEQKNEVNANENGNGNANGNVNQENNDGRLSPTEMRLVTKEQATEIRQVQASAEF